MNKFIRAILWLIILVLITSTLTPLPATDGPVHGRLHPLLALAAAERPEDSVAVIVQKTDATARAEHLVRQLGGRITKDLNIIHAFAAELQAGQIPALAESPLVGWISPDAAMISAGLTNSKFNTWATKSGTTVPNGFTNVASILSPVGPNRTYGSGSNVKGAFGGFNVEYTPGLGISSVELKLRLYASEKLGSSEKIVVIPYVNGQAGSAYTIGSTIINSYVGAGKAETLSVNITSARLWQWSDFTSLEILIDQSLLASSHTIYYDTVGLRIIAEAGRTDPTSPLTLASSATFAPVNTNQLLNSFNAAVRAPAVWNEAPNYIQGQGITVAVVDSGSFKTNGIGERLIGQINFNSSEHLSSDQYGHGTHVSGIIADGGMVNGGKYMGIAPQANILGLRVSDDYGMAAESDVISALQWVYNNRLAYNIKVVNLSLNSAVMQSYHTSPLDAAVEILWFNGIVVVVSAGNYGVSGLYPPANDPFVITVGATKDLGTTTIADDVIASFSAYGATETGTTKPELVAPGYNLIAYLPDNPNLTISATHPENRVDFNYFRMSGTSMSAPVVSGAAALLLQSNPSLTPDQVKFRLMATANNTWAGYDPARAGAGYLDVYAAIHGQTTGSANTGQIASQLLWTGSQPVVWGSVSWNSVSWNSVSWNSVSWNSVSWNSVSWNSDYWGP